MPGRIQKFTFGSFTGYALLDDENEDNVAESFPSIPEAELVSAVEEADYGGMVITAGAYLLLVDTGAEKVLIDAGVGSGELLDSLALTGVAPGDITRVIITHADGDHVGGLFDENDHYTFPNARYAYWQTAWDIWTTDVESMITEFMNGFGSTLSAEDQEAVKDRRLVYSQQILPRIKDRVDRFATGEDILPGFQFIDARGHRGDHAAVAITSDSATLIHVADSFMHPIQINHPDWASLYDSVPENLGEVNRRLLKRINEDDALVFGAHLSWPPVGRISKDGKFIPLED